MGFFSINEDREERPSPLGGGPLGLGDPNDKRLRKTEKDVIISKMLKEEATKRCDEKMKVFLDCAKKQQFMFIFNCRESKKSANECIKSWIENQELVDEVTEKYLNARSHYRRTGEPLERYERKKGRSSGFC